MEPCCSVLFNKVLAASPTFFKVLHPWWSRYGGTGAALGAAYDHHNRPAIVRRSPTHSTVRTAKGRYLLLSVSFFFMVGHSSR